MPRKECDQRRGPSKMARDVSALVASGNQLPPSGLLELRHAAEPGYAGWLASLWNVYSRPADATRSLKEWGMLRDLGKSDWQELLNIPDGRIPMA